MQIRVPVEQALWILGRLYGCGLITREQYVARVKTIDRAKAEKEQQKSKVLTNMIENSKKFYKKSCKQ